MLHHIFCIFRETDLTKIKLNSYGSRRKKQQKELREDGMFCRASHFDIDHYPYRDRGDELSLGVLMFSNRENFLPI